MVHLSSLGDMVTLRLLKVTKTLLDLLFTRVSIVKEIDIPKLFAKEHPAPNGMIVSRVIPILRAVTHNNPSYTSPQLPNACLMLLRGPN